jgi:LysM repeat protein
MQKYWIHFGLCCFVLLLFSGSMFIQNESNNLYVIQLVSSSGIWSDTEFEVEKNRFRVLAKYGFVYETSYLKPNKIESSKLTLGTYKNRQTAELIKNEIKTKHGFDTFIKIVKKRPALPHSPNKNYAIEKDKLDNLYRYKSKAFKGGTLVIEKATEAEYFYFTYVIQEHSVPTIKPKVKKETQPINNPVINQNTKTNNVNIHIVQKGETLNTIAKKYRTTATRLKDVNGIFNINDIKIGQELKIK